MTGQRTGAPDAALKSKDSPRPTNEATKRRIAQVQRLLAALGYDPGPTDGRLGRQTQAAVRKFERDVRMRISGRIDERLLARLETEMRLRTQPGRQEPEPMALPSPVAPKPPERGVVASVLGGLQRLLGRDFDSLNRPAELAAYCHANAETWIYDFGREAFVYCGNVKAIEAAVQAANPAPEASATR